MSETTAEAMDAKGLMRRAAYDARNAQPDKDEVSQSAVALLMQLPEYRAAKTILWYLDCRSELRTKQAIPTDNRDTTALCAPPGIQATASTRRQLLR